MSGRTETVVQLPKLNLRASFQPSTFDDEKRTVEVVFSTGARVLRGFWNRYYEELSLDPKHVRLERLNAGAPVLDTHSSYELRDVIGVVERAWIKDGEGRALIRFSEREEVAPIIADVKAGILRNISVGYAVHRFEQVEGGDEEIPVYRAVDWEPHEISLVPIPADAAAQVRSEQQQPTINCVFVTRGVAAQRGETMDPKEKEGGQRAEDTRVADDAAKRAAEAAREEGVRLERQRQADIRSAVRALPEAEREKFAQELIEKGATVEEARAKVLDKLAGAQTEIRNTVRIETEEDERDKWVRGAEAWLLQKAGVAPLVAKHTGQRAADPGEFRGLSLLDLARESLARSGVNVRGMDKMAIAGMALVRGGYITQSTSDFAVVLENVMHKTLQAAYATQQDTWSRFCKRGTVSDFRPHPRYRMGLFGKLDKLTENGEFKNKAISDAEKAVIQAGTVGNIINLSRQMIVNDDMGAFSDLATKLGRAARLSVEIDVYDMLKSNGGMGPILSDGKTLFHVDHGNIASTAGAPSVATFDNVRVTMAQQKDPWGNEFLDLRPAVWLGPLGLDGEARVVNDAQYDPDTANKLQRPNKSRGIFADIVGTPRLSGAAWFAFADPNVAPVLEVAFLDGQETPVLESQEGWRIDGIEWRVRFDYGVAGVDFRGAVRNAGQ